MKTNELTGAALNWAVGKAEGLGGIFAPVDYCGKWEHGGPIIEREKIELFPHEGDGWGAMINNDFEFNCCETPLIAAMRCYVASKLGNNIDIPEELT